MMKIGKSIWNDQQYTSAGYQFERYNRKCNKHCNCSFSENARIFHDLINDSTSQWFLVGSTETGKLSTITSDHIEPHLQKILIAVQLTLRIISFCQIDWTYSWFQGVINLQQKSRYVQKLRKHHRSDEMKTSWDYCGSFNKTCLLPWVRKVLRRIQVSQRVTWKGCLGFINKL
jgi:hypothetical protein